MFHEIEPGNPAAVLRTEALLRHHAERHLPPSVTTDWNCLAHAPEHMFSCGHGVCDQCVEENYPPHRRPYSYSMDCCHICGTRSPTLVVLTPPTTDPNILAIDGGGIRGIVALVLLKRLQSALGSDVCDYFEYIAGTSAGAI